MIPTGNVKFALVIAERPKYDAKTNPHEFAWADFLTNMPKNAKPTPDTETIDDNVWLIPLSTGMLFLNQLVGLANDRHIRLRILFLDEVPGWIKVPPNAQKAVSV
jgi:hypothetical protein